MTNHSERGKNGGPFKRRDFLKASLLIPVTAFLAACARALENLSPTTDEVVQHAATDMASSEAAQADIAVPFLTPTPSCGDDDDDVTAEQAEGPFFTPNTPLRTSLIGEGGSGIPFVLSGQILRTDCTPIAGALLDFWHADEKGEYDNVGFGYRGHQFADDDGRFELRTVVPGLYPGRTRHFHVKVQAPKQPVLTTQLYFPHEPDNERDGFFDDALIMEVEDGTEGKVASFSFVLDA